MDEKFVEEKNKIIDETAPSPDESPKENKMIREMMSAILDVFYNYKNNYDEEFFDRFLKTYIWFFDINNLHRDLQDELKYYHKILEARDVYGDRVYRWLPAADIDGSWKACFESVEWNIKKIKERGSDKAFVTPEGDNRYRVSKSIKLWVVRKNWCKQEKRYWMLVIEDEIERIIHDDYLDGKSRVRYENEFYIVHDRFELANLLSACQRGEMEFGRNVYYSPDSIRDIVPREFIYSSY